MSFTNKTPNYDLPQYIADDKPSYLGDFNFAMSTIDTTLKNNNDLATSANQSATLANETANNAMTAATNADTKAGNAMTAATNADTKAGNAMTAATNAQDSANGALSKFNFTPISVPLSDINVVYNNGSTSTPITLGNGSYITIAYNQDYSMAKVYGVLVYNAENVGGSYTVTFPADLHIQGTSNIQFNNTITVVQSNNTQIKDVIKTHLRLFSNKTGGFNMLANGNFRAFLDPYLLVLKNFNDA